MYLVPDPVLKKINELSIQGDFKRLERTQLTDLKQLWTLEVVDPDQTFLIINHALHGAYLYDRCMCRTRFNVYR